MSPSFRRVVLTVACLSVVLPAAAQDAPASKAVVRTAESRLEVEVGFEIERDKKTSQVSTLREMRSGDAFRLRLRPRQAARAYLFVSTAAGSFDLILPREAEGKRSSALARNEWGNMPDQVWLRMDKARGVERLYLFIANDAIDEIEELFASRPKVEAVDETWLLDLRNRLDGEGSATITTGAATTRINYRRRSEGPAVVFQEYNVRHK